MLDGLVPAVLVLIVGLLFGGMLLFAAGYAAYRFYFSDPCKRLRITRDDLNSAIKAFMR